MLKKDTKFKCIKRTCALALGVVLAFLMSQMNVLAAEPSVTYLTGNPDGGYDVSDSVTYTEYNGENALVGGDGVPKYYYVNQSCTISGRIEVLSSSEDAPVYLILGENVILTAARGICVQAGNALYICAATESGMGKLVATGEENQAGIGGNVSEDAGKIVINSGIVEATGGDYAAGIGGGNEGNGGNIVIKGGNVTATRGFCAAGIGGGFKGSSGTITINGGTVNTPSVSSSAGAGIGSGRSANSNGTLDIITINAGTVTAAGNGASAGIGGGNKDAGVAITINGGTINAIGGIDAAGIGGGNEATNTAAKITISGGTINATGGANAAGIGGGRDGNAGEIEINGGKITATGNGGGAGIGGGKNGKNDVKVTIAGGDITATGNNGGAGIGAGSGGDASTCVVKINDGTISAKSDTGKGINAGDIQVAPKFGDISFEDGEIKIPKSGGEKPTDEQDSEERENDEEDDSLAGWTSTPAVPLMDNSADNGGINGICTYAKQGPLCAAIFKAATPAGFKEAFSFNLNLDKTGKIAPNHDRKVGKLVLNIPKQYQKTERTFAIIGIDKSGKAKIFYDSDADDKVFTANIDIDGYAFSLIYSDSVVRGNRTTATVNAGSGDYVVKQGDSLSGIARKLGKSVRYLAQHNDIDNPDRLSVGQVLKY